MKKTYSIAGMIVCMTLIINGFQVKGQNELVGFLKGGIGDGEKLIQAYLEPLGNGMGANLNGGWYNTAKVHRILGFDLTLTVTAAMVPESAKSFDIAQLGLENLQLKPGESPIAPTFAGDAGRGPTLVLMNDELNLTLAELNTPGGVDVPFYPMPMIKLGVGLPKGIEINGRFIPTISYEDLSTNLWGIGIKYDVLQHFGLIDRVPFLNASVFGAYTRMNFASDLDFQKSIYGNTIGGIPIEGGQANYEDQKLDINIAGFTTTALFSADLPVITLFGGLGYSKSTTNADLLGEYPLITSGVDSANEVTVRIEDISNPVALEFINHSGVQMTAGLRVKLAVITLHASYTRANYNLLTAGLGISFR